jgi:predicted transposase/invertase (TIGR01784 family)
VDVLAIVRLKPKNDFIFRHLFGKQASEESLKALLNAILRPDGKDPIASLTIAGNIELGSDTPAGKNGRLDILAELSGGELINIEMQMVDRDNMVKRTLFYLSKLFASALTAGNPYESLRKTITINLLNFNLFPYDRFHSTYHFYEDHEERALLTDALEVHFIEFPKFERIEKDTSIALHRWLMFMDEKLPEDQLKELMDMDPIIAKTEEKLEELSLEERFRDFLDDKERYLRDWVYSVDVTAKKAAEEARKKALLDSRTEMAQKMLAKGMDLKTIAEVSGMSEEQIRQLQDE